jgi:hypothetical protein
VAAPKETNQERTLVISSTTGSRTATDAVDCGHIVSDTVFLLGALCLLTGKTLPTPEYFD